MNGAWERRKHALCLKIHSAAWLATMSHLFILKEVNFEAAWSTNASHAIRWRPKMSSDVVSDMKISTRYSPLLLDSESKIKLSWKPHRWSLHLKPFEHSKCVRLTHIMRSLENVQISNFFFCTSCCEYNRGNKSWIWGSPKMCVYIKQNGSHDMSLHVESLTERISSLFGSATDLEFHSAEQTNWWGQYTLFTFLRDRFNCGLLLSTRRALRTVRKNAFCFVLIATHKRTAWDEWFCEKEL